MSTFAVEVIKIKGFGKHQNADTLSITQVYSYPVIFRSGEFQIGDLAIYVPEEAVVPNHPIFEFLWKDKEPTERHRRVRAIKLRNIFSCGLLIPYKKFIDAGLLPDGLPEGINVTELLGITKYEGPEPISMGGDNLSRPDYFPVFTEIENIRKYNNILTTNEEVVFTEKIHGSCSSFVFKDDLFLFSSHHNVKKPGSSNCWNLVAIKYQMEEKLRDIPGIIIFGEVYGNIQKNFHYDSPKHSSFVMFDAFDINVMSYIEWDKVVEISAKLNLPLVPELYKGPYIGLEHAETFADGPTVLGNGKHIREGIVIRLIKERWNDETGRTILKLIGKNYLLQK